MPFHRSADGEAATPCPLDFRRTSELSTENWPGTHWNPVRKITPQERRR